MNCKNVIADIFIQPFDSELFCKQSYILFIIPEITGKSIQYMKNLQNPAKYKIRKSMDKYTQLKKTVVK